MLVPQKALIQYDIRCMSGLHTNHRYETVTSTTLAWRRAVEANQSLSGYCSHLSGQGKITSCRRRKKSKPLTVGSLPAASAGLEPGTVGLVPARPPAAAASASAAGSYPSAAPAASWRLRTLHTTRADDRDSGWLVAPKVSSMICAHGLFMWVGQSSRFVPELGTILPATEFCLCCRSSLVCVSRA